MLNTIVRYVKKEFPQMIEYIERWHDVSGIMDRLFSEEEAELTSKSESTPKLDDESSDRISTSLKEAASNTCPLTSASPLDIQEALPQVSGPNDDERKVEEISASQDSDRIVNIFTPSSEGSPTVQTSRLQKRRRGPTIEDWFPKRTKKS